MANLSLARWRLRRSPTHSRGLRNRFRLGRSRQAQSEASTQFAVRRCAGICAAAPQTLFANALQNILVRLLLRLRWHQRNLEWWSSRAERCYRASVRCAVCPARAEREPTGCNSSFCAWQQKLGAPQVFQCHPVVLPRVAQRATTGSGVDRLDGRRKSGCGIGSRFPNDTYASRAPGYWSSTHVADQ